MFGTDEEMRRGVVGIGRGRMLWRVYVSRLTRMKVGLGELQREEVGLDKNRESRLDLDPGYLTYLMPMEGRCRE